MLSTYYTESRVKHLLCRITCESRGRDSGPLLVPPRTAPQCVLSEATERSKVHHQNKDFHTETLPLLPLLLLLLLPLLPLLLALLVLLAPLPLACRPLVVQPPSSLPPLLPPFPPSPRPPSLPLVLPCGVGGSAHRAPGNSLWKALLCTPEPLRGKMRAPPGGKSVERKQEGGKKKQHALSKMPLVPRPL